MQCKNGIVSTQRTHICLLNLATNFPFLKLKKFNETQSTNNVESKIWPEKNAREFTDFIRMRSIKCGNKTERVHYFLHTFYNETNTRF